MQHRSDHLTIAAAFEGWADISADCRMRVEVAHGDGVAPASSRDHMRMVREQRERRVAVRAAPETRPAPQLLVTSGDLLVDGIGAVGADEGRLLHAGVGGKDSADGSVADNTHLVAGILREPERHQGVILAGPDGGTR